MTMTVNRQAPPVERAAPRRALANPLRRSLQRTRQRGERGATALEMTMVMLVGSIALGGALWALIGFNDNSVEDVARAQAESRALTSLNRITRDVTEAQKVLEASATELVVETPVSGTQVERTYYGFTGTGDDRDLVAKAATVAATTPFDPAAAWTTDAEVLGDKVLSGARFDYVDKNGTTTTDQAKITRVDITYEASVKTDSPKDNRVATAVKVSLTTSAAIKSAVAGDPGDDVAPTATPSPDAQDSVAVNDPITVTVDDPGVTVDVLTNDVCGNSNLPPCSPVELTGPVSVTDPSIPGVLVKSTGNGTYLVSVDSTYSGGPTFTIEYAWQDSYTDAVAYIVVTVLNPTIVTVAWPQAAPTSRAQVFGQDVVRWTGGNGPYAVYRRANSSDAWGRVSSTTGVPKSAGAYTEAAYSAPLGSRMEYIVVAENGAVPADYTDRPESMNVSVQYPPVPVTTANGSDPDGDGEPNYTGNQVLWAAPSGATLPPLTSSTVIVAAYKRTAGSASDVDETTKTTAVVNTASPGPVCTVGTACFTRPAPAGSETVYDVEVQIACDPDLPSGETVCRSYNGAAAEQIPFKFGTNGRGGNVAYQAPPSAPVIQFEDPNAATCSDVGGVSGFSGTDLYNCFDNGIRYGWTADGDADGYGFCADLVGACQVRWRHDPSNSYYGHVGNYGRSVSDNTVRTNAYASALMNRSVSDAAWPGGVYPASERLANPAGWGKKAWLSATACNPGGCGPVSEQAAYSFTDRAQITAMWQPGLYNYTYRAQFGGSPVWSGNGAGGGIAGFQINHNITAGAGFQDAFYANWTGNTATAAWQAGHASYPDHARPIGNPFDGQVPNDGYWIWADIRPGNAYYGLYRAWADTGFARDQAYLIRQDIKSIGISPPPVKFMADTSACSATVLQRYYGYAAAWTNEAAYTYDGSGNWTLSPLSRVLVSIGATNGDGSPGRYWPSNYWGGGDDGMGDQWGNLWHGGWNGQRFWNQEQWGALGGGGSAGSGLIQWDNRAWPPGGMGYNWVGLESQWAQFPMGRVDATVRIVTQRDYGADIDFRNIESTWLGLSAPKTGGDANDGTGMMNCNQRPYNVSQGGQLHYFRSLHGTQHSYYRFLNGGVFGGYQW